MAGLLLAAGRSTRMAGGGKLLRELRGVPLVRRAAEALHAAGLEPLVAVVGPDGEAVRQALAGLPVLFAENPRPEDGMASSLSAGVAALPRGTSTVAVALGDMPEVSPGTIRAVVETLRGSERSIAVPIHRGRRGHPVVFDLARHHAELQALRGDRGARDLLAAHADDVLEVPVEDPGVLLDIDTVEELEAASRGGGAHRTGMRRAPPPGSLAAALALGSRELVAIVGAGGKTSLMYRLGHELSSSGRRVAAATTTKILQPGPGDGADLLLAESWEEVGSRLSAREGLAVLGRSLLPNGKVEGIPPAWCDRLWGEEAVDVLVVEADGARRLPLKAPGDEEPVVPAGTTLFVAVVGLSCLGRRLAADVAFRPERVAAAAGCAPGDELTPAVLATLLASPAGLLKGRPPAARAAVFLNQADDPVRAAAGREVAAAVLGRPSPWERVIVGRLRAAEPIEEVWVR